MSATIPIKSSNLVVRYKEILKNKTNKKLHPPTHTHTHARTHAHTDTHTHTNKVTRPSGRITIITLAGVNYDNQIARPTSNYQILRL